MTLEQAIFLADELKPNQIERARKIEWLSRLDQQIYCDLIQTHERKEAHGGGMPEYTQDTPPDTQLLAQAPYDEIYRFCLETHIDLVNQEYGKYNNSAALFTDAWGRLARAYHREHKPDAQGNGRLIF